MQRELLCSQEGQDGRQELPQGGGCCRGPCKGWRSPAGHGMGGSSGVDLTDLLTG